jgi:MuDR family transposase
LCSAGGSNYLPIPTDQEEEEDDDDDDDDYNVESDDSENFSEDLDVELEDYDGEEIIYHVVSRMDQYNMFIGREEIHSARSMHDTIGWAPADYSLYEPRVSVDGPLAEHQTFNSKKHFQFAISMWHIKKNREYVVKDSSKQKLRVKCKDPDCEWRLYAKLIGNAKA